MQDNVEALIETVPVLIVQKYQPTTVKFGQCMRKLGLQSMSCFCAGSLPLSGSLSLYCFSLQLLFFIVVNKISNFKRAIFGLRVHKKTFGDPDPHWELTALPRPLSWI